MRCALIQMVGLYKDPKGETIFTKGTCTVTNNLPTQTIDELKKRVTPLEANTKVSKMCVFINPNSNFFYKF